MTNPYYAHTSGVPATLTRAASSQIRNEYDLIEDGLDAVETAVNTKAAHAGQVYTGAHDFTAGTTTVASPAALDDTTKAANTSWVQANVPTAVVTYYGANVPPSVTTALASYAPLASPTFTGAVTIPSGASIAGFAPLASPALTGTPTAPTATTGTSTTQLATTAFVGATAFSAALPAQTGNAGKIVTTDGSNASWASSLSGLSLTGTTLTGYTETVYDLSGTTPAFSEANGSVQTWTLSGASTPTDSLTTGQSIILVITPGAYSITWPSATWSKVGGSGAAPTLYSAGKTTVILWKIGSTLYASHLGDM